MRLLFIFCLFISLNGLSQTKSDMFTYVKNRIETITYEKRVSLSLSGCQMKYNYLRTLQGNAPWTQERSFSLANVSDVLVMNDNGGRLIILKFKSSEDVIITDIEQDGTRNFVNYSDKVMFLFNSGADLSEVNKIASLFKKLSKQCGAKIIEL